MGEHLLPGKLTFSGADGVDRLRTPIIRVCPPQESGGISSFSIPIIRMLKSKVKGGWLTWGAAPYPIL